MRLLWWAFQYSTKLSAASWFFSLPRSFAVFISTLSSVSILTRRSAGQWKSACSPLSSSYPQSAYEASSAIPSHLGYSPNSSWAVRNCEVALPAIPNSLSGRRRVSKLDRTKIYLEDQPQILFKLLNTKLLRFALFCQHFSKSSYFLRQ